MKLKKVFELRKGTAGIRGVPDGSGPEGKGPTGRRMGNCPKSEDYDNEEDFKKALKKWKAENGLKKSLELRKTKYIKRVKTQ